MYSISLKLVNYICNSVTMELMKPIYTAKSVHIRRMT